MTPYDLPAPRRPRRSHVRDTLMALAIPAAIAALLGATLLAMAIITRWAA